MKNYLKLSIFAISFFLFFVFGLNNIYADSQPMADYTYVDCENGSDTTGIPFDHSKPYLSLKQGIEKTILYINNNGLTNAYGTGGEYIHFIFEIRVKGGCKYDGKD
ncbi:MAG: hypothetical protein PHN31_01015 [Candidatus Gracilibacteria bacterium]|nr:hypothetical protein [Candidatus Gracilibacteria bacterium]